jgi:hypothetical protein
MSSSGNPLRVSIPGYELSPSVVGSLVKKGPLTLPQNATSTLFTVSGGAVLVTSLQGMVTTATGATATTLSLGTAPTVGTAAVAGIGGANSIASLVAGNVISVPATVGSPGATLVAPAVPSSGTASTNLAINPYHGTVTVTISGGTLTFVYVNGVQVGTTAGAYDVPQHGSISITYSVAPTWSWASTVNLEINANGTLFIPKDTGFIVSPGTITWTTSANDTGAITWYIQYIQLDNQPGDQFSGRGVVT